MTINITPVADAPTVALDTPVGEYGSTAVLINTGWESVSNRNTKYTTVSGSQLEGWNVVKEQNIDDDNYHYDRDHDGDYDKDDYCGDDKQAFILWSGGDKMKDANNTHRIVQPAANNGSNWLEMGDAMGLGHQTFGIERAVMTRAGASYNLSFDYAGRLG